MEKRFFQRLQSDYIHAIGGFKGVFNKLYINVNKFCQKGNSYL